MTRPHCLRFAAFLWLAVGMAVAPAPAYAEGRCTLDDVVAWYDAGTAELKEGRPWAARDRWQPLASAGFAPAQRQIAILHGEGIGLRYSPSEAAFWAGLASRAGDSGAKKLFETYRHEMPTFEHKIIDTRLDRWRAGGIECNGGFLVEASPAKKISFDVWFHRSVANGPETDAKARLEQAAELATGLAVDAHSYLSLIDGVEFYAPSDNRYHRHAGWLGDRDGNILRLPMSSFNDKTLDYLAQRILLVTKRQVYARLAGSELDDPAHRTIADIDVFGSLYPDIRNQPFFTLMEQALRMAEGLPDDLRKYVGIIDEVHYNPISRHMVRGGRIDAKAAYYDRGLSRPGHRIFFVRQDVLYSSPLLMLRNIVHEGTHAAQDQRAGELMAKADADQRKLLALQSAGKEHTPEAQALRDRIARQTDYANRWYWGRKTADGQRIQDIAFECEALMTEIAAVKAVGGLPQAFDRSSGYLDVCPNAQHALIAWRNERENR